jgi:hypothetical protein
MVAVTDCPKGYQEGSIRPKDPNKGIVEQSELWEMEWTLAQYFG